MGFVMINDDVFGGVCDLMFSVDWNEKDGRLLVVDDWDSGWIDLRKLKFK